ncbi:MAG TPA: hypothetical protein VK590_15155 [Saprospiraceae bacterium]|nr:hypothetical protein [Saprospiraceae bacterium]
MKTNFYTKLSLLSIILLLSACSKDDPKGCGGEDKDATAHCVFKDYAGYQKYFDIVEDTTGTFRAIYGTKNSTSFYALNMTLSNYCISEPNIIYSNIEFKKSLPEVVDTLYIWEANANSQINTVIKQVISQSVHQYYLTAPYIFDHEGGTANIANYVFFPSQGSKSKDSLFFFSNLAKMEILSLYKKL